jgi:hypothetical protein
MSGNGVNQAFAAQLVMIPVIDMYLETAVCFA